MALRLNLYGFEQQAVLDVLGSGDRAVLAAAVEHLSKAFRDPAVVSKAKAWLTTLIMVGCPLRTDRIVPTVGDDGGLLVMQMETEIHVFVVNSIVRAVAKADHKDLAMDSSTYHYSAVTALQRELSACKFPVPKEYYRWMHVLSSGMPLFGDQFHSDWSFYSILANSELAEFIPVLRAAATYERKLPEGIPPEELFRHAVSLSEPGKKFADDLARWFAEIHVAGQDAFVIWS